MKERRVDLHLVDKRELELVLRRAERLKNRASYQHRRAWLPRRPLVLPRGETKSDRERLESALLEVLLRLVMDGPHAAEHPIALLQILEERRNLDRFVL